MLKHVVLGNHNDLGRALQISNGTYELIITLDVGPRILHFSRSGGKNILADRLEYSMQVKDKWWHIYGGHRVWHSPETYPRTYIPDNDPVEKFELLDDGVLITQHLEPWTQIRKKMQIRFTTEAVEVGSILENCGAWDIETAVWAITVVKPGGRVILPLVREKNAFLPCCSFALWHYSRFNDRRVNYGSKYIGIDIRPDINDEYKIGYSNKNGWIAYINNDNCFVKCYRHQELANYPDFGSSSQVFICDWGGEIETLTPKSILHPGAILAQDESWSLFDQPGLLSANASDVDNLLEICIPLHNLTANFQGEKP